MTTYSTSEAQSSLEVVLDAARREGEVRIKEENGREYLLKPIGTKSPLDVPGVDLDLTADEIVNAVRESRER